ncbi:hypothetical protein KIN20_032752 [Parelaphostrongylus tenuis]|uniref:Uncharacterized protein n=1 Tax=Parelaphostrongylus tenuis TaxID=148309 RepID=A0AAD5WI93_PARTN|nr:hypothetical protein KIN20_032752 [Parelaphostrongylus tenuis]
MSSKPQLSPQTWRSPICRSTDSVHRDSVITSSTPAPLVVMKPKKVHSNVSEELHATLCELAEERQSLRSSESERATLQRTNMKIKADLRMAQGQLRFIREGKLRLRPAEAQFGQTGSESESNLIDCKRVDVSHQSSTSDELYKKNRLFGK